MVNRVTFAFVTIIFSGAVTYPNSFHRFGQTLDKDMGTSKRTINAQNATHHVNLLSIANIPRVIHVVVRDEHKLPYVASCIMEHENWKVRIWTDERIRLFVQEKSKRDLEVLDKLIGAKKSDFFRVFVLHQLGGVYLDADVECVRSLDPYLAKHNAPCMFTEEPDLHKVVLYGKQRYDLMPCNFFMAGRPNTASFELLLNELRRIAADNTVLHSADATDITGPRLIGRMIDKMRDCHVAPASLFAPAVAWNNPAIVKACNSPNTPDIHKLCSDAKNTTLHMQESFTIHHWAHSWLGDKYM